MIFCKITRRDGNALKFVVQYDRTIIRKNNIVGVMMI